MSDLTQAYSYRRPSALTGGRLGLETSGGTALRAPTPHPRFFTGFLTDPAPAAAGLLALAHVARTRYYQPDLRRFRDPVLTCNGDRLRAESFSACCGVYARLDVLSPALDGEMHDRGTTNIDINEPLRRALSRLGGRDPLHLAVGPDEVAVTTLGDAVVERKVPLPQRWLRGFAEVQVITAGFDPRAELTATESARFLRSLPRSARPGDALWAVPAGRTLRLAGRAMPGAVCLAGPRRLEALTPLLPYVRALRVYGPAVRPGDPPQTSAWEFDLPGMRLTLALSPDVRRGFSGEGAVLTGLTARDGDPAAADADLIGALLDFEPRVEVDLLAERSGLPAGRVRDALTRLGTAGRVGYDLAEAAYFHRELPYDAGIAEAMNPRLANARGLVAAGAVRADGTGGSGDSGDHGGSGDSRDSGGSGDRGDALMVGAHRVRFSPSPSCTCPWWTEYRGSRGACKHVLAAGIVRDGKPVTA